MRISQHVRRAVVAGAVALAAGGSAQPAPATAGPVSDRWALSFNGAVHAIAHRGDTVYVGGAFTRMTINGRTVNRNRLAAYSGRTGELLDWAPSADDTVRALAVVPAWVYVGGDFNRINGEARDALARIDAGDATVGSFDHTFDGSVRALTVGDGRLYAAGPFRRVDGRRHRHLAAFSLADDGLDETWRPRRDFTTTVGGTRWRSASFG